MAPWARRAPAAGLLATVGVHLFAMGLAMHSHRPLPTAAPLPREETPILWLAVAPSPKPTSAERVISKPAPRAARPAVPGTAAAQPWVPQQPYARAPGAPLASHAAPPAPTAEQWAFAAGYTLKNSKAYRHTWGQHVRSMMGTAVEGPDQGAVRFRVEIASDGRLARLDTLWTTSAAAERLARQAIRAMPAGPATPTGRPLIFERTIVFSAFAHDDPPLYKDDCKPDLPSFSNPFAWDGRTPMPGARAVAAAEPQDPQALADCLRQLPKDTIEAEQAYDRRLLEQWASPRLGR